MNKIEKAVNEASDNGDANTLASLYKENLNLICKETFTDSAQSTNQSSNVWEYQQIL